MGNKVREKNQKSFHSVNNSLLSKGGSEIIEPKTKVVEVIAALLLAYATCVGFRIIEFPAWQAEHLHIQDEFLMATHDAYVWLAGAEQVNRKTDTPFSQMLFSLHNITGLNLANVSFWVPVIFAPLAALPLSVLALREKQPEAAVVSGIMAAGCLGFLLRTRFGFVDTDILALFFPLSVAAGLTIWLSLLCRTSWRDHPDEAGNPGSLRRKFFFMLLSLAIGCLVQGYEAFYGKVHIAFALIGIALLAGLFFRFKSHLQLFLLGFAVLLVASFGGWIGLGVGALVAVLIWQHPSLVDKRAVLGLSFALALTIAGQDIFHLVNSGVYKILSYAKVSTSEVMENAALSLPAIAQSVREAQNVNWGAMAARTAGSWWLFWPGMAGFVYLIYRRPLFIVWLPLLGLGIASVKLGNRFAMFGGAAIGLGLSFGLNRLLLDLKQPKLRRWAFHIALGLIVAWPLWSTAVSLKPVPILPSAYAQTFLDLRQHAPQEAQLWQWWDYGYAAQYYAHRRTFGDGGKHRGNYLYPLGKVHSTHSPLQARQMIKLVAATQQVALEDLQENGTRRDSEAKALFYPGDPVQKLRDIGPEKAQAYVESLKVEKKEWPEDLPPQFFVVSWENLRLAYWISFYGNWDLVSGKATPGKIQKVKGKISLDTQKGQLQLSQRQIPLDGLTLIGKNGGRRFTWSNGSDLFAVLNQLSNELYVMDGTIYNSMMFQMLVNDPADYEEHFELVVDHWPWARAYRVK